MGTILTSRVAGLALPLAQIAGTPSHMPYMSPQVHHGLEPLERPLRGREVWDLDLSYRVMDGESLRAVDSARLDGTSTLENVLGPNG